MRTQYPREARERSLSTLLGDLWRKLRFKLARLFVRTRRKYRKFDEDRGRAWRQKASEATSRAGHRASDEVDELIDDSRHTYARLRPRADTEAKRLRREASRRYKIARVRTRIIAAATLLWTKRIIATAYLAAVIGAIAFIVWWLSQETEAPNLEIQTSLQCATCELRTVTRVIDGDTLDVANGERIRIFGADTPETGERCYNEATAAMRQMAGTTVRIEPGPRPADNFNRSLYYLYTRSGDSIDELLIRNGLAVAWTQDGQHRDVLTSLQLEAASNNTGCLWG